jgi:uncharacterized protein YjbJ (UPF0337 family)
MADWDQVEGGAKERAGKVTGDEGLEGEGKVQGAWGDVKERGDDATDTAKEKAGGAAEDVRDRI